MFQFLFRLFVINLIFTSAYVSAKPLEVDRIVAVVNNDVITSQELERRTAQITAQLTQRGTSLPAKDQLEKQILERIILEKAQLQLAKETALKVDDAMLESALERIASNNKMDLAGLRAAVTKDGMTWTGFREDIRKEIILTRLREREVDSRIYVADAEVDAYLSHNENVNQNEMLISHILLRAPEGASPDQWEKLSAKALEITQRLKSGEDFAKLSATYSNANDAMQGGSLGWRGADRLPSLYAEVAGKLKVGEVSPVLRSSAGLHIIKLVDQRAAQAKTPETVEQTHARHILIKSGVGVDEASARHTLNDLRERLAHGADFGQLAKQYSNDLSAGKGGDLGWLSPGDTVPEFERAMNTLKDGEVSQVVQSPFGFHLIQVLEHRTSDVTDERRRFTARQTLRERKIDDAYEDWLRQLRDRTYVELRADRE